MTDGQILFSAPMVLALLAGRKSQTRRLLRLPKWASTDPDDIEFGGSGVAEVICRDTGCLATLPLPYMAGDRLWVKETWCRDADVEGKIHYRADGEHVVLDDGDGFTVTNKDGSERSPWKSSLFMSRGLSRLTLLVTDVRVERLEDISHKDAAAEGLIVERTEASGILRQGNGDTHVPLIRTQWRGAADLPLRGMERAAFRDLWERINGADSWKANPWVVAVSFSVHASNIDKLAPVTMEAACA